MRPFGVAYVKGYRRSLTMLIVVQGIRELGIEDIELPYGFQDMWDIRIMLQHAMQKCRGMQTLHRVLSPGRSQ